MGPTSNITLNEPKDRALGPLLGVQRYYFRLSTNLSLLRFLKLMIIDY
jgi:hypothetical protein